LTPDRACQRGAKDRDTPANAAPADKWKEKESGAGQQHCLKDSGNDNEDNPLASGHRTI
jgi:hypothetical protein